MASKEDHTHTGILLCARSSGASWGARARSSVCYWIPCNTNGLVLSEPDAIRHGHPAASATEAQLGKTFKKANAQFQNIVIWALRAHIAWNYITFGMTISYTTDITLPDMIN